MVDHFKKLLTFKMAHIVTNAYCIQSQYIEDQHHFSWQKWQCCSRGSLRRARTPWNQLSNSFSKLGLRRRLFKGQICRFPLKMSKGDTTISDRKLSVPHYASVNSKHQHPPPGRPPGKFFKVVKNPAPGQNFSAKARPQGQENTYPRGVL